MRFTAKSLPFPFADLRSLPATASGNIGMPGPKKWPSRDRAMTFPRGGAGPRRPVSQSHHPGHGRQDTNGRAYLRYGNFLQDILAASKGESGPARVHISPPRRTISVLSAGKRAFSGDKSWSLHPFLKRLSIVWSWRRNRGTLAGHGGISKASCYLRHHFVRPRIRTVRRRISAVSMPALSPTTFSTNETPPGNIECPGRAASGAPSS